MEKHLSFTGIIVGEGDGYWSLCPELDVASEGETVDEARAMLLDAVKGYLQICFEEGAPHLRPTPPAEDPRNETPDAVAAVFVFQVDANVRADVSAYAAVA
jgi:predicted RNase H-like HicB family nuclease